MESQRQGEGVTRILLAVSESSILGYPHPSFCSESAFDWIVEKIILRSNTSCFKLFFLHVQPRDEMSCEAEVLCDQLLQYFLIRCGAIGVQCEGLKRIGFAREVICEEVGRTKPDLLVVGSSQLPDGLWASFWSRFFNVDDVSEYSVKHAECHVLTIKPKLPDENPES